MISRRRISRCVLLNFPLSFPILTRGLHFQVPSGGWPKDPKQKEIGLFAQGAVDQDIEGFIVFITSVLKWSKEEVQVYIAHLRREFRAGKFHAYYWQKVVWGRKPEA